MWRMSRWCWPNSTSTSSLFASSCCARAALRSGLQLGVEKMASCRQIGWPCAVQAQLTIRRRRALRRALARGRIFFAFPVLWVWWRCFCGIRPSDFGARDGTPKPFGRIHTLVLEPSPRLFILTPLPCSIPLQSHLARSYTLFILLRPH